MASLLRSVSLGLRLGATKSCGELCPALSSFVLLKKSFFIIQESPVQVLNFWQDIVRRMLLRQNQKKLNVSHGFCEENHLGISELKPFQPLSIRRIRCNGLN